VDVIYRYDPSAPLTHEMPAGADEALKALHEGNLRFLDMVERMHKVALGEATVQQVILPISPLSLGLPLWSGAPLEQAPFALVLGCSDARVPVESIFDQAFNDLFVVRIAGNVLGTECLGSIDYAVRHFAGSLKLVVVLGHSGCGAVTAAADTYLSPDDYGEIACTHALRSLLDRIHLAVRKAAKALERVCGQEVMRRPGYRGALIELAVVLNAAVTAYDLRREIAALENPALRVVYGVYDLKHLRVRTEPAGEGDAGPAGPPFSEAPARAEDFNELGARLARAAVAHGILG
jgi:carbonic anhydrase